MMENIEDENKGDEESFAALLDSYSSVSNADIQIGDKIQGKIISIGKDTVFVDTGTKIDGAVEKAELLDENQELTLKEGDVLELFVVDLTENEIKLSKALSGIGGLHMLREAYQKEVPVEGKITETCKGGFHVEVMHRRAFCPISQIDLTYVENPADYVGGTHRFLITQFEENGRNIVLSRRILLRQEQERSKKAFYKTLTIGAVLDGKITRVMPYGAFVQLSPGVEGMVHVSELSWSKTAAPDQLVKVGDTVRTKVIDVAPDKKPGELKISLSIKQTREDPWNSAAEKYHEGEKIKGIVTRCASFGAFVEIAPGIEGLVHISEMSYTKRVLKPEEIVRVGETVAVLIKEIDPVKRRIALSIKDAEGDPWIEVPEKYSIGQIIEGVLEKKEKFGYFINLEPGVTGLLPRSKIARTPKPVSIEKLREGDSITVAIEEINPQERKITLAPEDSAHERDWQEYAGGKASMGALGEKLQQAIASKKKT